MCPQDWKGWDTLRLVKSDEVTQLMKDRHIGDMELKLVIEHGEATGEKLHEPGSNRFLAKVKYWGATYYVEYSPVDGGYNVHTGYLHRSTIV